MTMQTRGRGRGSAAGSGPGEPPVVGGRTPPHDFDAEAAVLAACLLDSAALDRVLELIAPEHFYSEANGLLFAACRELSERHTPVDVVTVAAWLRSREQIQQVGGAQYLAELVDTTPAVANVGHYASIVKEKWRLRRVIALCQRYAAEGYGDVGDTQQFIDAAEQAVYDLARTPETTTVLPLKTVLSAAFDQMTKYADRGDDVTGVPTRFVDLDKKTAGLHPGDLVIVAARPGMGKSAFVLNVAVNVASPHRVTTAAPGEPGYGQQAAELPGYAVAVFSLEMPKEQLAQRMMCSEARVDLARLRGGFLDKNEWTKLTQAASVLSKLPIWIDDSPMLGVLELRAKVRRLKADYAVQRRANPSLPGLGLVVVDYLQLMRGRAGVASREQEISEISRGLKALAKELEVPVIALSQLNRGVETRGGKDKRPMLADLRESGAIEQDADTIVFIYRDDYYNRDSSEKGIAELIIAKQRNGPTGTVRTRFALSFTRFENLAPDEYQGFDGGD